MPANRRNRSLAALLSFGLVLALIRSSSAQQPADSPSRNLIGTWTLSSVERLGAGSTSAALPLPRGLLVFDSAGHAFELATSGRRAPYAANQPTPAEAQLVFASFGGFWGSYKVDEAQHKVTYRPEGAVSPNAMGQNFVRSFELTGDHLVVSSSADSVDGPDAMRWTWDRVPLLENLTAANRGLVGFWQHVVERRVNVATGAVLSETHRAPSIIVYTPSGYVGVHFPPLNRQRFAGAVPTDDEARAAIAGYVGYYGSYTLHPGIVFHHRLVILGAAQGDSLKRFYEITSDEINLKFPPTMNQGQQVRTVVTLKRLSGESDMLGKR
jgi:lipocalin-like protein